MATESAERLKQARIRAGYRSAQEAAEALGWGVPGYRHHENGTRNFGIDSAKRYGRAFKVKPGWLLCMAGVDDQPPTDFVAADSLVVEGMVAAGVWREPTEDFATFRIDSPAPVANSRRVGFVVEGHSMDQCYEPGTVLDCVSIFANGTEPEDGDHVIVERIKPDGLRELTVKEFRRRDGQYFLIPRSTRPEFQREIPIGAPDPDAPEGSEEVRVVAFVVSVIPPRALRLLERMGRVHR